MTHFSELTAAMNSAIIEFMATSTADFGTKTVIGIYTAPAAQAFGGLVAGEKPYFEALTADLAGVAYGDTVTIGETIYHVASAPVDLNGLSKIDLELAE